MTESVSFLKFSELLEIRLKSGGLNIKELSAIDMSPLSPARAWLVDQSINPLIGNILSSLIKGASLQQALQELANETRVPIEDVKTQVKEISFRTTAGWTLVTNKALGIIFKDKTSVSPIRAAAFVLNKDGHPQKYDIGIENLKLHLIEMRTRIENAVKQSDRTLFQRMAGYAYISLSSRFVSVMSMLNTFEYAMVDLQGVLDAIRFKLTLDDVDTVREAQALQELLREATEHRERLINLAQQVEGILNVNEQKGRLQLMNELNKVYAQVEGFRRKIKNYCGSAVNKMDVILGYDTDAEKQFRFDTPWELSFVSDKAAVQGSNLATTWESIRTFQIIVEERKITREWTEIVRHPAVKDADGKVTQEAYNETVTHTSEKEETDHKTIQTPSSEMKIQSRINAISDRVARLSAGKSDETPSTVMTAVMALKDEQANYRQQVPRGEDRGEERVKRIANQLAQIDALIVQVQIAQIRAATDIAIFSREPLIDTSKADKIAKDLALVDRFRRRVTTGVLSISALSGAGYSCFNMFQSSGGF